MAKPIPRKAASKKRKAEIENLVSAKAARKKERQVKEALDEMSERISAKHEWAEWLYKQQLHGVQEAVDRMVKQMAKMAGPPRFVFEGQTINVDTEILKRNQRRMHLWIAMRLLAASAEWGIRIGDFKAPKSDCLRCGAPVKPKKKGKKK